MLGPRDVGGSESGVMVLQRCIARDHHRACCAAEAASCAQARGESDGMFKGEALGLQALYGVPPPQPAPVPTRPPAVLPCSWIRHCSAFVGTDRNP